MNGEPPPLEEGSGQRLTLLARAKINLHLEVLGRLPNGYHAVETLLQSVELADRLTVETTDSGITIYCDDPRVPRDESNLIVRAAEAFFRFSGCRIGLQVLLEKRIPMGAGLGGGSADAAAILVALNRICQTHYPQAVLERIGASVGADVPFQIAGGTQWAFGIGADLVRLPSYGRLPVVIVFPGFEISTKKAYTALGLEALGTERLGLTFRRLNDKIWKEWVRLWASGRPSKRWSETIRNRFETVVFEWFPQLEGLRDELIARGAVAHLTGSGSAIYGVFRSGTEAQRAAQALQGRFSVVLLTQFAECGVSLAQDDSSSVGR